MNDMEVSYFVPKDPHRGTKGESGDLVYQNIVKQSQMMIWTLGIVFQESLIW